MIKVESETENDFQAIADAAFAALGLKGDAVIEVSEIDAESMRALNRNSRGIDSPTDVLSFPLLETIDIFDEKHYPYSYDPELHAVRMGAVVICGEIAESQGREYGHGTRREKAFLFLHGLLHVLGYDHMTIEEETEMNSTAEGILSGMGITREQRV